MNCSKGKPEILVFKDFSLKNEISEMKSEINELKSTIKELSGLIKAVYEFENT